MFTNSNISLFFSEYTIFIFYILLCIALACALLVGSLFFVQRLGDEEKISAYECGFSPYGDARSKIEIKFYLTAILFIVFDMEVVFLFPGILVLYKLDFFGIIVMCFFLTILVVGFIYEWLSGAMDG